MTDPIEFSRRTANWEWQRAGNRVQIEDADGNAIIDPLPAATANVDRPAANTAAVITYAGAAGQRHVIGGVAWSYDADPTGGNLQITVGGAVIFSVDITCSGPGFIPFFPALHGNLGGAMVITLAAGGGAVVGKVDVLSHWTV